MVTMVSIKGIVWNEVAAGDLLTVPMTHGVSTQKMVFATFFQTKKVYKERIASLLSLKGSDFSKNIYKEDIMFSLT